MPQISGVIQLIGLLDLLQVVSFNHRDLALHLNGHAGRGDIFIRDGNVIHAELAGRTGPEVFPAIIETCADAAFVMEELPEKFPETVDQSLQSLLLKSAAWMAQVSSGENNPEWHIEGSQDILPLQQILQIYENNKAWIRVQLIFDGPEKIFIDMVDGGIARAFDDGREGADAVYRALRFTNAKIRITPLTKHITGDKLLHVSSTVLEGLRRLDELTSPKKTDLHADEVLDALAKGELDISSRLEIAKRYLPGGVVPPASAIAFLTVDIEQSVRKAAMETLLDLPDSVIETVAADPNTPRILLRYLLLNFKDAVVTAAICNTSIDASFIAEYAPRATLLDMEIIRTREDLLKDSRQLRRVLLDHPDCPYHDILQVFEEEAAPKKRKHRFDSTAVSQLAVVELEDPVPDENVQKVPSKPGPKDMQFIARRGSLRQKREIALGNDDDLAVEVVSQPGAPEPFILMVAESPSANAAALKAIGSSTVFKRSTGIVNALLLNPKTPVGIASSLLSLARVALLAKMVDNRDLSDGLRQAVRHLLDKKKKR